MKKLMKTAGKAATLAALLVTFAACAHSVMMFRGGARRPPASDFGLGPRASAAGRYTATLQPSEPLRVRKLQSVRVTIQDSRGQAVDGATIAVDGGMPQHGHGLPTRPRVTDSMGAGAYEISGVRFNMGGWWELKLAITGDAGTDTVTFNLAL